MKYGKLIFLFNLYNTMNDQMNQKLMLINYKLIIIIIIIKHNPSEEKSIDLHEAFL